MTAAWHGALFWALTGTNADLGEQGSPDLAEVGAALAASGWSDERLHRHALDAVAAGEPWPHPVPDALRAGLGAAQFHAALGRLRAQHGLDVLVVLPPSQRTRLNPEERRLMVDVPPHYGGG